MEIREQREEQALERLFQQWYWLNGAVFVARIDRTDTTPCAEAVLAESTAHARWSSRLVDVLLDWLTRHIDTVDERRLLQLTQENGDLAVLGILSDLARSHRPHPKLDWLVPQCPPHEPEEIFFHLVARYQVTARLTRENPHKVFRRWGYLCRADEVQFLTKKASSGGQ